MLRLMLLRHAKAIHSVDYDDFDRPLVEKGREAATLMGAHIASRQYKPQMALVSSAQRTQETFAIVKDYTGHTEPQFDSDLYLASPEMMLAAIQGVSKAATTLLVVGHNPGIALLASALAGSGKDIELRELQSKFPTCALAVIDFDGDNWASLSAGAGTLEHFVYPKLLGSAG